MATNLIQNLESRSVNNLVNARVEEHAGGARASYHSCYVVDQTAISQDGNLFKLVVDLGDSYF